MTAIFTCVNKGDVVSSLTCSHLVVDLKVFSIIKHAGVYFHVVADWEHGVTNHHLFPVTLPLDQPLRVSTAGKTLTLSLTTKIYENDPSSPSRHFDDRAGYCNTVTLQNVATFWC